MNHCYPLKWHKFFKAACDKHRQQILALISQHRTINANQIIKKMDISQPTTSHHLKILSEAGLILAEKKGKEVFYSINKKNISSCCLGFMNKLTTKNKN
jgi:DNA-binding transcriptional ArsR family regulator